MLFYPGEFSMTAVWLVAMIVLLIIEGIVPGLVSIWFAIGAFAAMISAILGAPLWLQVLWFFAVSILTLCLTRPFAKKYVNSRATPTNADMLIGKECVVTEEIDNVLGTGAVTVGGKVWTARTEEPDGKAETGTLAAEGGEQRLHCFFHVGNANSPVTHRDFYGIVLIHGGIYVNLSHTVGVSVDNAVRYRLAHRRFDVGYLIDRRVKLSRKRRNG